MEDYFSGARMLTWDIFWHKALRRPYRLHVVRHGVGKRSKPVIVLLHGLAASGKDWEDFIPLLTPQYECITIDLLGFGDSPKPEWGAYDMDAHMASLRHTIDKLGLRKDFVLAGHSLGSLLASRYASQAPTHVSRLLLLSPPVYPPLGDITGKFAKRLTGVLLQTYKILRSNPRITPENFAKLAKVLPLPRGIILNPETWQPFMCTLQNCIEEQTILEDVAKLEIPVDVFYGSLDQLLVSSNVELLAQNKRVRLHQYIGSHDLTKRYAKLVVKQLS